MGKRRFQVNKPQNACPKCGNTHAFIGRSEQVAEDLCDIWVECDCGFNPFENNSGYCIESVWGSLDEDFLLMALDSWNELTSTE
ncbi:hypothetical protein EAY46_15645 [Vibrio anguillarum]|uniref:Restriction alleviation protein, Lar family n=1 Tax=Vibrio anguillarum TaxID=55601 RepID=A0ABR9Z7T5_VIBAN|nr:hypothetical protein [Vibrio anguillarum]